MNLFRKLCNYLYTDDLFQFIQEDICCHIIACNCSEKFIWPLSVQLIVLLLNDWIIWYAQYIMQYYRFLKLLYVDG